MPRPSAAACTSPQRSAAASDLRKPPDMPLRAIARKHRIKAASVHYILTRDAPLLTGGARESVGLAAPGQEKESWGAAVAE